MSSTLEIALRGLGASPGEASGSVVLSARAALAKAALGPVILVCDEASAEDVPGVRVCAGVVLIRGGLTADGAIVARALGIPCVVSVPALTCDRARSVLRATVPRDSAAADARSADAGGTQGHTGGASETHVIPEGSHMRIDGKTGVVSFELATH